MLLGLQRGQEYKIEASLDGFVPGKPVLFSVPASGEPESLAVTLSQLARMTGIVVDSISGEPLAGAGIRAVTGSDIVEFEPYIDIAKVTDESGSFTVETLLYNQRYRVQAHKDNWVRLLWDDAHAASRSSLSAGVSLGTVMGGFSCS